MFIILFIRIEREKFYPGPGLEPGPLALRANALTNWAIQGKHGSTILSDLRTDRLCRYVRSIEVYFHKLLNDNNELILKI